MSVKNPESRIQNPVGGRRRGLARGAAVFILATGFWILDSAPASAAPSQEDVFRSIQENVGERPSDGSKGFALLLGGGGVLIMVLLVASRVRARQSAPRTLQHSGKLLREVMKTIQLKPKELKQLKLLADETKKDGSAEPVDSPLTLLLCPSVLARTMKDRPPKVDRAVMAQLVRRMGLGK